MKEITKLKKREKANKGITLIALVITIIVLLILATISIATLTGENGVLNKVSTAKTRTTEEEEKEQIKLAYHTILSDRLEKGEQEVITTDEMEAELKKLNGDVIVNEDGDKIKITFIKTENAYTIDSEGVITGPTNSGGNEGTEKPTTVKEARAKGIILDENNPTTLKDEYENQIVVPEGFKIASDSANDVTGGVVIEDVSNPTTAGSQFVWIPVGTIYTSKEKATSTSIELNRYLFANDGTPSAYGEGIIENIYQELEKSSYGNITAKNINEFKESVKTNKGYYIGRYEARTTNQRTVGTNDSGLGQVTVKPDDYVYNYITQQQAVLLSQGMYTEKTFTSDLVNSYVWDTAIVFIQTFGQNNYSRQTSLNNLDNSTSSDVFAEKGTNHLKDTIKQDKQCNIWDMASNYIEWSTETYFDWGFPCVYRGRNYFESSFYTSGRSSSTTTADAAVYAFRLVLYF